MFPNIFLDIHIWVLILRNTKNSGTSYKNLWETFKAQCYGKCGNCMPKFSSGACFKSGIKKISCIAQIYILHPPFPQTFFFPRVLLLLVNIVIKRSFFCYSLKVFERKEKIQWASKQRMYIHLQRNFRCQILQSYFIFQSYCISLA